MRNAKATVSDRLTVRLLVAGTGTVTTELLGLAVTSISNEEGAVVAEEEVLDLGLGGLVDVCKVG